MNEQIRRTENQAPVFILFFGFSGRFIYLEYLAGARWITMRAQVKGRLLACLPDFPKGGANTF
ncbi:hypothetical protein CSB93_0541 [Pseudomonas paraeruginosa]|uniref:Uncharacterized protein n=1 Tax=Pseudomonas paraeruginosa TaxID=2994495 RepID=A0A2R3IN93_9PSED|nr:hypothetical protein CSB93_0541 [Pseudomonas paraeruginosa]